MLLFLSEKSTLYPYLQMSKVLWSFSLNYNSIWCSCCLFCCILFSWNIHIFCQLWRPENHPCFASNAEWFYAKNAHNWEGKSVYFKKNYLTENRLSRSKIYCAEDSPVYMSNIRAKKFRFEHQKHVARVLWYLLLQWVTYFSGFWMLFRNLCVNLSPQSIYAHTK